jgi:uncharacterized membrane protein
VANGSPDKCAVVRKAARRHPADGIDTFNQVEGVVDHQILGVHRVNETLPREQWIWWDLGFLTWDTAMPFIGWLLHG